jgi:hypothetical protein
MKRLEKSTDLLVYEFFKNFSDDIIIEPKKSENFRIQEILSHSSKKNTNKTGFPEYIISFKKNPNLIIVIEDKKDKSLHESKLLNQPIKYAVDGAVHYGKKLSKEFDVISIGVSGCIENDLLITHHLHLKGSQNSIKLEFNNFKTPEEYLKFYETDERKNKQNFENLLKFSDDLNKELFKTYKIKEDERAILIAAILVSLKNLSFKNSYKDTILSSELCESISIAVKAELRKNLLSENYVTLVTNHLDFICLSPKFRQDVNLLKKLISDINNNVNCYIINTEFKDVLGSLYVKFLEKANGDKQLGIVLTPEHITKFMCKLCELTDDSLLFDNCSGTGGFLLSASKFKSNVIGIEYEPKMFTLMVLNMMIHNLPLNNIWQGDSLTDESILSEVKNLKPNAGVLNPPYDGREWEFIDKNIKLLQKKSKCVALVPMSLVTSNEGKNLENKKRFYENHTIDAVFSMPNELFFNSNTSVVTCIIVFTSHIPHPKDKEVFFGYYKDDGFEKRKKFGRFDINSQWNEKENEWFWAYKNGQSKPEFSITKKITYEDEWCAENFLETDYDSITTNDFVDMLKKYAAYKIIN